MAEGRNKNSKTGVLMSMNFGGINQSSATGTRPYVSRKWEISPIGNARLFGNTLEKNANE